MSNDLILQGDFSILKSISKLDWRMEEADSTCAIAYQLDDNQEANQKLEARLKAHSPALLILSRKPSFELSCPYWIAKPNQWSSLLHDLCEHFFPINSKLKLLGVTGTNGKTTTADLVLQMGEMAGLNGFSIGTLGVRSKGRTIEEFGLTTPGQIQLRKILHDYGASADFVVMEVSSHALDQDRVYGLHFTAAAWTNLTQDHLDYHKSMDEYFRAKEKIIKFLKPGAFLYVPEAKTELRNKLAAHSSVLALIDDNQSLPTFLSSGFNKENFACAKALAGSLGVEVSKLDFSRLAPTPGRFYVKQWENKTAVVDFAHTPDALENVLQALRNSFPRSRLITLFGCGGDRDRTKRPLMGEAVDRLSDFIIVTSDNPRTENPEQIIQDIVNGIKLRPFITEVDRPTAVRNALGNLKSGDVLLMAGKGHEDYIIKGTTKVHYSDIEELDAHIARNK